MFATAVAALLLAAPVKVAVPGYTIAGLDRAVGTGYADHFVALLGRDGRLQLTTQADIAQVLGLERQMQLLGCADDGSACLAELAGALGVDAILSVTLVKSGPGLTATLRMLRASDGKEIAAASARFRNEDALQDWLEGNVGTFAGRAEAAFSPARPSFARWVPAIAGGAALVAGGTLYGLSRANAERLRGGSFATEDEVRATTSTGRTFEGAGVGLMIGGGVAVAASILWVALGPSGGARVAFFAGPDGAAFSVAGAF